MMEAQRLAITEQRTELHRQYLQTHADLSQNFNFGLDTRACLEQKAHDDEVEELKELYVSKGSPQDVDTITTKLQRIKTAKDNIVEALMAMIQNRDSMIKRLIDMNMELEKARITRDVPLQMINQISKLNDTLRKEKREAYDELERTKGELDETKQQLKELQREKKLDSAFVEVADNLVQDNGHLRRVVELLQKQKAELMTAPRDNLINPVQVKIAALRVVLKEAEPVWSSTMKRQMVMMRDHVARLRKKLTSGRQILEDALENCSPRQRQELEDFEEALDNLNDTTDVNTNYFDTEEMKTFDMIKALLDAYYDDEVADVILNGKTLTADKTIEAITLIIDHAKADAGNSSSSSGL